MTRSKLVQMICALLVVLFVYAAASKLFFFRGFTNQMLNQPLPRPLSLMLVWLLPAAELSTAALLFFSRTRSAGLWASLGLMTLFTGYVALVLSRAFNRVPCSCGGIFSRLSWPGHLAFNLVTLVFTGLAIRFHSTQKRRSSIKDIFKFFGQGRGSRKPVE